MRLVSPLGCQHLYRKFNCIHNLNQFQHIRIFVTMRRGLLTASICRIGGRISALIQQCAMVSCDISSPKQSCQAQQHPVHGHSFNQPNPFLLFPFFLAVAASHSVAWMNNSSVVLVRSLDRYLCFHAAITLHDIHGLVLRGAIRR